MVDFSTLLRTPAGHAKKPGALPVDSYPAVIKSWEVGDNNKNKTPYVRFVIGLTDWPDGVSEEERQDNGEAIDLSKRQMRRDYYLTDDARWRLEELLAGCGLTLEGSTYEELLPQMVGMSVVVEVQQYINQQNNDIGNQVGKISPT